MNTTPDNPVMRLVERLMRFWNVPGEIEATEIYADEYCGFDVTDHSLINGPAGVNQQVQRFRQAFPDLEFRAEEMIRNENRIALYWSARGTHRGTLLNIPPTGRKVELYGVTLLYLQDGKIFQSVHLWDMAAMLRALGLLPELERMDPIDQFTLRDALTIC